MTVAELLLNLEFCQTCSNIDSKHLYWINERRVLLVLSDLICDSNLPLLFYWCFNYILFYIIADTVKLKQKKKKKKGKEDEEVDI